MLMTPRTADAAEPSPEPNPSSGVAHHQQKANRQAIISVALVIAAIVAVFVALSTVTPVAFAALGFLPLVQYRLMGQLTAD